mgnify:FL=1|tara:strand:- start:596 stop:1675 length:1080 start_codon:yes stop_codon:yes gene_type:complete
MPGYNKNTNRFLQQIDDSRQGGLDSAGALSQMWQYHGGKKGLLGNFGSQGQNPAFANLGEAESYRNANPNNSSAAQELINRAYKGVAPDDYAKKASNFLEQNMGTPGKEGEGLLGGMQTLGGLGKDAIGWADQAMGGYGKKLLASGAEKFAKTGIGEAVKSWGTQLASSSLGAGVTAAAGAIGAVAAPLALLKQGYDFVGAQHDAHQAAKQGQKNTAYAMTDVNSQSDTATNDRIYKNQQVARILNERRGTLTKQLSGKAEQVIKQGNTVASRSNLEGNENNSRIEQLNKEGVIDSYMDNSSTLTRQKENLQQTNVEAYNRTNKGLIAQNNALQGTWDELDEERKSTKLAAQFGDVLGM